MLVLPQSQILSFKGKTPKLGDTTFLAPNATIVGDVTIGNNCSFWYGSSVRGDDAPVTIGDNVHLHENVIVHVADLTEFLPTIIGNNTIVRPKAIVHACTIESDCFVGDSAIVLDGSVMKKGSALLPHSVLTPHKILPPGELWGGCPARKVKDITQEELAKISETRNEISQNAALHQKETAKNVDEIEYDKREYGYWERLDNDYPRNAFPVHPERRGLIYNRLPEEMNDPNIQETILDDDQIQIHDIPTEKMVETKH